MKDFVAQQVKDMDHSKSEEEMAKTAGAAYTAAKKLIDFANSHLDNLDELVKKQ